MGTTTISPLRQRMIEDMNARKLGPHSQRSHIQSCKRFAAFLKRSPDTATAEDIRRFQLHLVESGMSICNRNRTMTGVRFLFRVTLRRLDLATEIYHIKEPQKIPLVMSPDETKRLLAMARSLKVRVLLSLGYGCGPRAGEVVRLKAGDIDSAQSIIRIEQSKGRKDRNVMLSPELLGLLRQWWKVRPTRYDAGVPMEQSWLFPGRAPGRPMTTRQLNRLFHETADAAGIKKPVTLHALRHSFATHLSISTQLGPLIGVQKGPHLADARRRCAKPLRSAAHRRRAHWEVGVQARFLKRQLSLPVSMISQ